MAVCPKCGEPRRDAPACRKCGLAIERMAAYARGRDAAVPAALHAAWDAVADAWDDPARHEALLHLTLQHGCYAWTAERYRCARGQRDPEAADRYLERVRSAVEVTLLATATRRDASRPPYRSAMLLLVPIVMLIVVGLVFAAFVRARAAGEARALSPSASQVR